MGTRWSTAGSDGGEPESGDGKQDSASGGDNDINDNADAAQDAEEAGGGGDESGRAGGAAMRSSLKQKIFLKGETYSMIGWWVDYLIAPPPPARAAL